MVLFFMLFFLATLLNFLKFIYFLLNFLIFIYFSSISFSLKQQSRRKFVKEFKSDAIVNYLSQFIVISAVLSPFIKDH